ncbi:MAG: hypothetical protein ACHQX3_00100 [Nitrospirales bacterium]
MADRREQRSYKWYRCFDTKTMQFYADLDDQEQIIPAVYGVCPTCDGKGKHVNPAIDSHGISPEEFDEDPGFREDYFSGLYDMRCVECGGNRVVPVPCGTPAQMETIERAIREDALYRAECAAERRMGC